MRRLASGFRKKIEDTMKNVFVDDPIPSRAEARRRIRSKPGFFTSLTPEQRAIMLGYDGPEVLGYSGHESAAAKRS